MSSNFVNNKENKFGGYRKGSGAEKRILFFGYKQVLLVEVLLKVGCMLNLLVNL